MRGFTLVEVLIALVLLEVGLLGVTGTLVLASRTLSEVEARERRTTEVTSLVRQLAHGGMAEGASRHVWGDLEWAPAGAGDVRIVARGKRGDSLVLVTGVGPGPGAERAGLP